MFCRIVEGKIEFFTGQPDSAFLNAVRPHLLLVNVVNAVPDRIEVQVPDVAENGNVYRYSPIRAERLSNRTDCIPAWKAIKPTLYSLGLQQRVSKLSLRNTAPRTVRIVIRNVRWIKAPKNKHSTAEKRGNAASAPEPQWARVA